MKLLVTDFLAVATEPKSEMTSNLNNGYDVMNYFAIFEKFLSHIVIPSFMTVESQMPELDRGRGLFCPLPCRIGSQNTPYKLGLKQLNASHW